MIQDSSDSSSKAIMLSRLRSTHSCKNTVIKINRSTEISLGFLLHLRGIGVLKSIIIALKKTGGCGL